MRAPLSPIPGLAQRLAGAAGLLDAGRFAEARQGLQALAAAQPGQPDLQHLYGVACWRSGDLEAGERALRAAIAADRRRVAFPYDLGRLLIGAGRDKEGERSLRAALALERRHAGAATALAELLTARGRPAEALQVTTPLLAAAQGAGASPPEAVLAAHAEALRALGRHEERLEVCERAVQAHPRSAVAEHNVAAALGDLGRHPEAEAAARRAFAKGLDAPETWLALGRALLGQAQLDGAEAAFRAALVRRPGLADAHRELAQLVWMRTGELAPAAAALERDLAAQPADLALHLVRLQLLDNAGDTAGLRAALELASRSCGASPVLETTAARALLAVDPAAALGHAEAACRLAPQDRAARMALCEASLAAGRPREAEALVSDLRRERPDDQHLLAYQATAWRLLEDPRYAELYDYERFVRSYRIEAPLGWGSLEGYLADLRAALLGMQALSAHPFGQSLRGGSQTPQRLQASEAPAVQAFFRAIDVPIRRHIAHLGAGKDPLRARNRGGYAVAGAWSVRLHPGGRHVDHVHQMGWLSSAFYVDLPPAVEAGGREGWIKFGQPGTPTLPALEAERFVKPEPGLLVLFPSYMWHGTAPFGGEQPRLTVAFDVAPAAPARS